MMLTQIPRLSVADVYERVVIPRQEDAAEQNLRQRAHRPPLRHPLLPSSLIALGAGAPEHQARMMPPAQQGSRQHGIEQGACKK
jgi:hypothetical protein